MVNSIFYDSEDIHRIARHVGVNRLMDDAIAELTIACREFDPKSTAVPARDGFEYSEPDIGLIEWMPVMKSGGGVVIKIVGYHPSNPSGRGIPTILSTALAFDTRTGELLAVMDATFLTAVRTGAASAVASRILASPQSRVLGLVGAGAQSVTQLHALSRVFDLEQVMVYDADDATARTFAERTVQLGLPELQISTCSADELVSSADIICTATSVDIGEGPVFRDSGLKPAVHINAVGSDFSGKVELPHSLLLRSLVCPDFTSQALREGECQQLHHDQVGPDLVELVKDEEKYRAHQQHSTVFDSTGWALEDFIVFGILAGYGQELGYGKEIEHEKLSSDPKNPYAFVDFEETSLPGGACGTSTVYAVKKG